MKNDSDFERKTMFATLKGIEAQLSTLALNAEEEKAGQNFP